MDGRSQCSHCGTALSSGAKYCSECGAPQALIVLDLVRGEDPPVITGTDMAPHARLTMLAGLVLVAGMLAVLWGLSRQGDPADEEPLSSETPEDGILAADTTTSATTVVSDLVASPGVDDSVASPAVDDSVGSNERSRVTLTEPTPTTGEGQPLSPGSVARIDPETNQVTAIETGLGEVRPSVVVGEGTVWAFEHGGRGLARIDPETNTVMSRIEIVGRATGLAIGEGSMWAVGSLEGEGVLFEMSAETGRFRRAVGLGYSDVRVFAVGAGVSIYEGVSHILAPAEMRNPLVNYVVLILAMLFEGVAWTIAFKEFVGQSNHPRIGVNVWRLSTHQCEQRALVAGATCRCEDIGGCRRTPMPLRAIDQ